VRREQTADQEGRAAHDAHGDEEGVLAADQIAQPAEHQRAKRSDCESRGECCQREDEARDFIHTGEELRREDGGEQSVDIKVVPFEDGAQRGRTDHQPLIGRDCLRHRQVRHRGCLVHSFPLDSLVLMISVWAAPP
jgi:hypothetical protein